MSVNLVFPVVLLLSSASLALTVVPEPDYFSILMDQEDIENDLELDELEMAMKQYDTQNKQNVDSIWKAKVTEKPIKQESDKTFLNHIKNLHGKQEYDNISEMLRGKIDKKHFLDHIKNLQMKQANSNMMEMLRGKKNNQEELVMKFLERIKNMHLRKSNANRWNMLRRKMLRKKDVKEESEARFFDYIKNLHINQAKSNMLLMLRGKKNSQLESRKDIVQRSGMNWSNSNLKIINFFRRKMLRKKDDMKESQVQFMDNIKNPQMKQANSNMIDMLRGRKGNTQDAEKLFLDYINNLQMSQANSNMWEMLRGKRESKQDSEEQFLEQMKNLQMKQARSNMMSMLRGKKDNSQDSEQQLSGHIKNLQMKQANSNMMGMLTGKRDNQQDPQEQFLDHMKNLQMKQVNSNMMDMLRGKKDKKQDSEEQFFDHIKNLQMKEANSNMMGMLRGKKDNKPDSEEQFFDHMKNLQMKQADSNMWEKLWGKKNSKEDSQEQFLDYIKDLTMSQADSNMWEILLKGKRHNKQHSKENFLDKNKNLQIKQTNSNNLEMLRDKKKNKKETKKQLLSHIRNCELRKHFRGQKGNKKESNEKSFQCAARMSLSNIKKLQVKQATSNMFHLLRGKKDTRQKVDKRFLDLDWIMLGGDPENYKKQDSEDQILNDIKNHQNMPDVIRGKKNNENYGKNQVLNYILTILMKHVNLKGNQLAPMDQVSKLVKTHQLKQASSSKQKRSVDNSVISPNRDEPTDMEEKHENKSDRVVNSNEKVDMSILKGKPIHFKLTPKKNLEDNLEDSKNSPIFLTDLDTNLTSKRSPLWWMKLRPVYQSFHQ